MAVVDRADAAEPFFRAHGVPFRALITYRDLGIARCGTAW
jgi:orotate phosphoribosyltransferase